MRVSLISFASPTGLGYQTKDFYDHIRPEKTLLVDLSRYNHMPIDPSWYPDARISSWVNRDDIEWLCDEIDTIFFAETPLEYGLIEYANNKGIRTVQQYNYEFLDYPRNPDLPRPTILAAPTGWNAHIVQQYGDVELLPVPINRERFPFRQIEKCKTLIHIIGRPAVHDRNGTLAFLDVVEHYKNEFEYRVFLQTPKDVRAQEFYEPVKQRLYELQDYIEIVENHDNPSYIYRSGDVLVIPRRYGGLCLPAQEALSSGLPVIMTDISPNYDLLPKEWLCDATFSHKFHDHQHTYYAHVNVDVYNPKTDSLLEIIDQFRSPSYMCSANHIADQIAHQRSWQTLLPQYLTLLR